MPRASVEQLVVRGRPLWAYQATCYRCRVWTRVCGGWRAAAAALREHQAQCRGKGRRP